MPRRRSPADPRTLPDDRTPLHDEILAWVDAHAGEVVDEVDPQEWYSDRIDTLRKAADQYVEELRAALREHGPALGEAAAAHARRLARWRGLGDPPPYPGHRDVRTEWVVDVVETTRDRSGRPRKAVVGVADMVISYRWASIRVTGCEANVEVAQPRKRYPSYVEGRPTHVEPTPGTVPSPRFRADTALPHWILDAAAGPEMPAYDRAFAWERSATVDDALYADPEDADDGAREVVVDVRAAIPSLTQVLQEIRALQRVDDRLYVVVSPDDRWAEHLRAQGIGFVRYPNPSA